MKPQNKTKDMEFSFREALLKIFFDIPKMNDRRSLVEIEKINLDSGRQYQRERQNYAGKYLLHYSGRKFAELQRRPHKKIILFEQFDNYRLPSKILERVALTYIPEAKVERKYGE